MFKVPNTITAFDYEKYFHYKPAAALTSSSWIEFRIAGTEEMIDLSKMYIEIELKILQSDGSALPSAAAAAGAAANLYESIVPANYLLGALIQQLDVYLSNTLITTATNMYAYRAYLDTLLYNSEKSKKTYEYTSMYEDDKEKRKERIKRIYSGKSIKLVGPLHTDLGQQERLLISFVDIIIRLNLSDPSFCLQIEGGTTDRPKIQIVDTTLHVCKRKLFIDNEVSLLQTLETTTAKYFYNHTMLRHRIIDENVQQIYFDQLFPSSLPRRFVVGIVPAKAMNGDYKSDPFQFSSQNVSEIKAYIDSQQVPVPAITLDMSDDDFARAYFLFFQQMNSLEPTSLLSVTPAQYKSRSCFFAFTLSPENDLDDGEFVSLIRRGNCRLDISFKAPTTEHLALIIYSHFPSVLQIAADRTVLLESV